MAISPLEKYPGQVESSDPAYPYGRARNVDTPGDGTGTPWEKLLINDIFGFQQALLVDAALLPNGQPDKVGASQYLAALKKVIANAISLLPNAEFVWQNFHTFVNEVTFQGLTNLNLATLQAANELVYTAPKQRRVMIPLTLFQPTSPAGASAWELVEGYGGLVWSIADGAGDRLVAQMRLPAGCIVTGVNAFTSSGPSSTLGLTAGKYHFDTTTPVGTPSYTAIGADPVQASGVSGLIGTGYVSVPFAEGDLLYVKIDSNIVSPNISLLWWCEVIYTELRATGSQ